MDTVCRAAKIEDLDDINILFQTAERNSSGFSHRQEIVFQRILKEQLVDILIIEKDQYVVGCCHCAIIPTLAQGGRSYALVNQFVIDPLNRKQGLASALLEFATAYARKKGCYDIYVVNDKPEPWHANLLSKFGFKKNMGMFVLGGK